MTDARNLEIHLRSPATGAKIAEKQLMAINILYFNHCRAQVPLLSVCQHINEKQTVLLPGEELMINLIQEGQKSFWVL